MIGRVAIADRGKAHDEMSLIEIPGFAILTAQIGAAFARRRLMIRQVTEMLLNQIEHLLVTQITRGGNDHIARGIMRLHVAHHCFALHRGDKAFRAECRATHRLVAKCGFLKMIENDVVRRIIGLADFLQDYAAFALDFLLQKRAVGQDVADDIDAQRQIFFQQLDVIGRLLTRRIGVYMATDILDLLGNASRRAAPCTLESHMFEKMGNAVFLGSFVTCSGSDIGAEGNGFDAFHPFGHDGKAIGRVVTVIGSVIEW